MEVEEKSRLAEAIRQPVSALTVVVVESSAQARNVITELQPDLESRPHSEIALTCEEGSAGRILQQAQTASADWPPDQGVLFVIDETLFGGREETDFWRAMNLQRENWARLKCHVVFLLKPRNYSHLIAAADHLLSWIPLKFDFRKVPASTEDRFMTIDPDFGRRRRSVQAARQTLQTLEEGLAQALGASEANKTTLVRAYYLPMIEAAVDAGETERAATIASRVKQTDVPESDLPRWWTVSGALALALHHLDEVENVTLRLLDWARQHEDASAQYLALTRMGRMAEQKQLIEAEEWYRRALDIAVHSEYEAQTAFTCYRLGEVVRKRQHKDEAEGWFRKGLEILDRILESAEPRQKERLALWLSARGLVLERLGELERAVEAYEDVVTRFGNAAEPELKEWGAMALVSKGATLGRLKKPEDEIVVYDDVVARFGNAEELVLKEQVATALVNKGFILTELDRMEEAVAACDQVEAHFSEAAEPKLRERFAQALLNRGVALEKQGKREAAFATFAEVSERFGESEEPKIRETVATAIVNAGAILGKEGRFEEAASRFDDVVQRFGDSREQEIKLEAARAFSMRSLALLDRWRETGDEALLQSAIDSARRGVELGGNHYNLACALAVTGNVEEAFNELEGCLARGEIAWAHVDGDPGKGAEPDRDWDGLREHPRYEVLRVKYGQA